MICSGSPCLFLGCSVLIFCAFCSCVGWQPLTIDIVWQVDGGVEEVDVFIEVGTHVLGFGACYV